MPSALDQLVAATTVSDCHRSLTSHLRWDPQIPNYPNAPSSAEAVVWRIGSRAAEITVVSSRSIPTHDWARGDMGSDAAMSWNVWKANATQPHFRQQLAFRYIANTRARNSRWASANGAIQVAMLLTKYDPDEPLLIALADVSRPVTALPAAQPSGKSFVASERRRPPLTRNSYNCGGEGHMSRECPEGPKDKTCYKCGQPGHISRDCNNPQADAAGRGVGGFGGQGGGSQECYKVCPSLSADRPHLTPLSAPRSDTLLATALRPVATALVGDSATHRATVVGRVDTVAAEVKEDKPATRAVATATCPVCFPLPTPLLPSC